MMSAPEVSSDVPDTAAHVAKVPQPRHTAVSLFGISAGGDKTLGRMFSQESFYLCNKAQHRRFIVQQYVIRAIQFDQLGVGN